MTKLEILKMLAQDLGATTKQAIAKATEPLLARISDLEDANLRSSARIRSLELASTADAERLRTLESQLPGYVRPSDVQTH